MGALLDFHLFMIGFCTDALSLAVAKVVCRLGDGEANNSIWRLWLTSFYFAGHVYQYPPSQINKNGNVG